MFSRVLGIPLMLGAAVGVPYVATNGPDLGGLWDETPQQANTSSVPRVSAASFPAQGSAATAVETEVANVSLQEALRFDVSKEWVYQRWTRKSTALSKLGLYGIRVALVTGTELHDVAGSLTYLFGQDGRVQRISFRGRTGDTTQLVMLATRRYGLQQQRTAIVGEQLFQIRRNDLVFSELRTRPAPILRTSALHDSFQVSLELQRPDSTTPLPPEFVPPPIVKQPEPPKPTPPKAEVADAAEQTEKKENDDQESWKAFFPRSRVPEGQVESLDKRGRIW